MVNVRCMRDMTCVLESGHPGSCDFIPWPTAEELKRMKDIATAKQVGGDHYEQMAIQPWEVIQRGDLDYLIEREQKNGA